MIFNGWRGDLSTGVEKPPNGAHHSTPAKLKNEWKYTSTAQNAFITITDTDVYLLSGAILTFWRLNYFFNFSTLYIQNVNNT